MKLTLLLIINIIFLNANDNVVYLSEKETVSIYLCLLNFKLNIEKLKKSLIKYLPPNIDNKKQMDITNKFKIVLVKDCLNQVKKIGDINLVIKTYFLEKKYELINLNYDRKEFFTENDDFSLTKHETELDNKLNNVAKIKQEELRNIFNTVIKSEFTIKQQIIYFITNFRNFILVIIFISLMGLFFLCKKAFSKIKKTRIQELSHDEKYKKALEKVNKYKKE